MRIFGKKKPQVPKLEYTLLQIVLRSDSERSGALPYLLDEVWQACRTFPRSKWSGSLPPYVSLEIRSKNTQLTFYIWLPEALARHLSRRLESAYPNIDLIELIEDYSEITAPKLIVGGELVLTKDELLPILPLDGSRASRWPSVRRQLEQVTYDNEAWIQILLRPVDNSWKRVIDKRIQKNLRAKKEYLSQPYIIKATGNGFNCKIRFVYRGRDRHSAQSSVKTLADSFRQNSHSPNDLALKQVRTGLDRQIEYHVRLFIDKGYLLNTNELSSLIDIPIAKEAIDDHPAAPPSQSRFQELLAEAENNPQKPKPRSNKKVASKKPERAPRGVVQIATQAKAKKDIGKVATSKSQTDQPVDEVVIKLR